MLVYPYPAISFPGPFKGTGTGSALDHIELTYHDVTVFAIPEIKSLEALKKTILQ